MTQMRKAKITISDVTASCPFCGEPLVRIQLGTVVNSCEGAELEYPNKDVCVATCVCGKKSFFKTSRRL